MSNPIRTTAPLPVRPPSRHEMAVMIWIAVFPTLTLLNLALGGVLAGAPVVLRTLVLTTIAVPIVIYGLMPPLQRTRAALLRRRARR
jgi:antibiotic biosynthesis monooxygenase (ABM) superfamily enzyme